MEDLQAKAEKALISTLAKEGLHILRKPDGREGVDFVVKDKKVELFVHPADLIALQRVKIPKEKLGTPRDNLWVALLGFIPEQEPLIFLIPTKKLADSDDYIFFNNEVKSHPFLSNWEIKIFTEGMQELGKYVYYNQISYLT